MFLLSPQRYILILENKVKWNFLFNSMMVLAKDGADLKSVISNDSILLRRALSGNLLIIYKLSRSLQRFA